MAQTASALSYERQRASGSDQPRQLFRELERLTCATKANLPLSIRLKSRMSFSTALICFRLPVNAVNSTLCDCAASPRLACTFCTARTAVFRGTRTSWKTYLGQYVCEQSAYVGERPSMLTRSVSALNQRQLVHSSEPPVFACSAR